METIISLVVEKTGLSEDNARQATTVVIGYIKEQLPESMQGIVDKVIAGETPDSVGDLVGGALGGLFGGDDE